jgi:long-subunit acyl-CoA synthetase (AMP-forming)
MLVISEIIKNAYEKWKDKGFVFEKIDGEWKPTTYGQMIERADVLAHKLIDDGLEGKNIMIFSRNCADYLTADLAITAYVGAVANANCQIPLESVERLINKANIEAVLYEEIFEPMFAEIAKSHPEVKLYPLHKTMAELEQPGELFDFPVKDPEVCSKIIFTSGTTSDPKGVMLSLRNIFAGWDSLQRRTPFTEDEVAYCFLPMHHTYGNIYNFLYSLIGSTQLYLCSDTNKIAEELLEVKPTIFCAVPIIYRRLYEGYGEKLAYAFGGRAKYLFCGGALLDHQLRRFYKEHGLMILEAYALTETGSSFSIEYPNNDDFESTGTVFEDMDVKVINQDANGVGDIVAKGNCVFIGYLNDEEKTKEAFTEDGYFITGDYGRMSEDRHIYVMGRKKDVLIGENGENVYINDIQAELMKACESVAKIKGALKDGGIFYTVYIKDGAENEVNAAIEKYNESAVKANRIANYELLSEKEVTYK